MPWGSARGCARGAGVAHHQLTIWVSSLRRVDLPGTRRKKTAGGVINIVRGKGGKGRSVVVGIETRRALLAYRRDIGMPTAGPLFITRDGQRFMRMGIRDVFTRLTERTGIKVTPHALRRTFATLSLRAGMNPIHLQGLLGHSTLDMTRRYIQMVDDDLVEAHKHHGPIDNILRRR